MEKTSALNQTVSLILQTPHMLEAMSKTEASEKLRKKSTMQLCPCHLQKVIFLRRRSITRDVIYNEGVIRIFYNPGNRGDFEIIQGDPKQYPLGTFNSGDMKTKGEAYNFDFDGIDIEYGPDKPTSIVLKEDGSPNYMYYDAGPAPHWERRPSKLSGLANFPTNSEIRCGRKI